MNLIVLLVLFAGMIVGVAPHEGITPDGMGQYILSPEIEVLNDNKENEHYILSSTIILTAHEESEYGEEIKSLEIGEAIYIITQKPIQILRFTVIETVVYHPLKHFDHWGDFEEGTRHEIVMSTYGSYPLVMQTCIGEARLFVLAGNPEVLWQSAQ